MKHFTLLGFVVLLSLPMQGQLLVSGFEDWTGSTPDGWFGIRTNLPQSGVQQVSNDVHGGTYAVRLIKASAGHQRFTTQDLTVVAGQLYEVRFWVRGEGQIRLGIYDGRPTGSGYAPYNPQGYVTITGNTWQEVVLTISAVMDATDAQFILSLQNTVAPEHLVVDDVTISAVGSIPVVSIYDIQYTTDLSGDSPYAGQQVQTSGIVTAVDAFNGQGAAQNIYYLQDGSGSWRGIYVFDFIDNGNVVEVGDHVELTATVSEYFNLTELTNIAAFNIVASGQPLPAPLVINTGDLASEALESVLVRVENATCTEAPGGANFGKYKVDDGSGDAVVGKEIHTTTPAPLVGQAFNITGVVSFTNFQGNPEYNLQPRSETDIELATAINEAGMLGTASVYPNPAIDVVTLHLGEVAGQRVEYTFADATGRVVGGDVLMQGLGTVDVSHLTNGLYILTLRSGSSVWSTRVMVQH